MTKHFQSPHLLAWIIVGAGIIVTLLLAHFPTTIPYASLGPVGTFLSSLAVNYRGLMIVVFWSTVISHAYEASVARGICQQLRLDGQSTLLWSLQTFVLGFPSLTLLKKYARQRQ